MQKAFTLIELMVAILLLGMIITFLLSTLGGLRLSSKVLFENNSQKERLTKTVVLLQNDIVASDQLKVVESDNYISLELRTNSSLYGINNPYVRWFVDPKEKVLIRSESAKDFLPPYDNDKLYQIHIDSAIKSCEWFKAYSSNDKKTLLIGLSHQKKPLFLEIATPQFYAKTTPKTDVKADPNTGKKGKEQTPASGNKLSEQ